MNDNQNFERIIKKEKRKKLLITAVISSIVTVTIGFVAVYGTNHYFRKTDGRSS